MTVSTPIIARVAVPSPVFRYFDYLPPRESQFTVDHIVPGVRVRVPFGRRELIGMVVGAVNHTDVEQNKLKHISELLDEQPILSPSMIQLLQWAARYYHYPPGEVFNVAMPTLLRKGGLVQNKTALSWSVTQAGKEQFATIARAVKQKELLNFMLGWGQGVSEDELSQFMKSWRPVMKRLLGKSWVYQHASQSGAEKQLMRACESPELTQAQRDAVHAIAQGFDSFCSYLLDGVTGSGKTEVYLQLIAKLVLQGRQCLIIVPEIGLTPQLVQRFRKRFNTNIGILHSGLSEQERLKVWLAAQCGEVLILIGTRSAAFTPLRYPGIYIIDEEHDLSLKQQDGFRYHARDFLIKRAKQESVPIVLGSATPSLESLANVELGRAQRLVLPARVGRSSSPTIHVVDMRRQPTQNNMSQIVLQSMDEHIRKGDQVLLFLNRRGFSPTLLCKACGWVVGCRRCDAHMTFHKDANLLICHHCGAQRRMEVQCEQCSSKTLLPVGYGTERVERVLRERYPGVGIIRIDRDTTRKKHAMNQMFEQIHQGQAQVLIGTQMLAKGHHFSNVTMAVILSADHGFYSVDFRGSERMAQLIVQVAGRAGREKKPGIVYVQSYNPDHPLLRLLIQQGYTKFAQHLLAERAHTHLPPYSRIALLRAEASKQERVQLYLQAAVKAASRIEQPGVQIYGPIPAAMARRAGHYRGQILIQAFHHESLQRFLANWLEYLAHAEFSSTVRWSLDIDPMEIL